MKNVLIIAALIFSFSSALFAQWIDSVKIYWLEPVEVTSQRLGIGEYQSPVEKDNLSNLLGKNGFVLIRKGVFFAQDIYADGFKRGDINVVIDGERYHSACPNRMDSPLTRVNPLELESISLMKTSGSFQSGLGGKVTFHRITPVEPVSLKAGFSGSSASSQGFDGSFSAEGFEKRLTVRYSTGLPYKDGDSREFKDLYGYKDNFRYSLAEASFQGKSSLWKYGATFSYTENVSFPYLQMDEIKNRVVNASVSYDDNKLYLNYTDHLMNNLLRESTCIMESDAKNLTVGIVGNFYEVFFRSWNVDNVISMPMMKITNDLMPDVKMYSASVFRELEFGEINFSGRAGLVHSTVGEESRFNFYQALYPDAKLSRWFPTFGISAYYTEMLNDDWGAGALLEAGSEAPETEHLFIAVQKPMNKPNWSGNPELSQPIRTTVRGSVNYDDLIMELFGTRVWNYVNLTTANVGTKSYMSYENIDAYMLGFNIGFSWKFIETNASYTYAQNITNNAPLSEIPPLKISTTLTSPEFSRVIVFLRHIYNDSQTRIDETLNEDPSPAWKRIDLGASYSTGSFLLALEIINIANVTYYQHLSYMRDPFAAGMQVYEPGRIFRLNIKLNSVFE